MARSSFPTDARRPLRAHYSRKHVHSPLSTLSFPVQTCARTTGAVSPDVIRGTPAAGNEELALPVAGRVADASHREGASPAIREGRSWNRRGSRDLTGHQ